MCVFLRFWVYWETIGVFFRIFPKVDKVDLARSSQNRGLRFQMYVLAEKRAKNFKFKKRKNSLLLFFCEQSSYFCCTLSERGRYTRADTHGAILAR